MALVQPFSVLSRFSPRKGPLPKLPEFSEIPEAVRELPSYPIPMQPEESSQVIFTDPHPQDTETGETSESVSKLINKFK